MINGLEDNWKRYYYNFNNDINSLIVSDWLFTQFGAY